jgi:hypothetical protein
MKNKTKSVYLKEHISDAVAILHRQRIEGTTGEATPDLNLSYNYLINELVYTTIKEHYPEVLEQAIKELAEKRAAKEMEKITQLT